MSESTIDYSQLSTFAQFAEKAGTTPQTVQKWADAAGVKPVFKAGVTNVYLLPDLQSAMESFSTNAKAFKALGYVHPDMHKAVVDHRDRLIQVSIERDARIMELEEDSKFLAALRAAGVDNWDGYDNAMSMLRGETDEYGDPAAVTDIYNLTDEDILTKAAEFGVTILTDV